VKPARHEDPDVIQYLKDHGLCIPHAGNCGQPIEVHHLKSRGSGGGDHNWNCISTCREAHSNIHAIGLTKACFQYPALKKYLLIMGWEFDQNKQKWIYYNIEGD
jgi:hypothetical protein